jgi:hypothetical protein
MTPRQSLNDNLLHHTYQPGRPEMFFVASSMRLLCRGYPRKESKIVNECVLLRYVGVRPNGGPNGRPAERSEA